MSATLLESMRVPAILAMTTAGALGVTISDNFDSYTAGSTIPAGNGWIGWGGPAAANGIVSSAQANSPSNSLSVVGGAGTDQVLEFGYESKTGAWEFTAMTYLPSDGKAGHQYFNLMNTFDEAGGTYHWSNVEMNWMMIPDNENVDKVFLSSNPAGSLDILYDQWVEVRAAIDLDSDTLEVFYGGDSLGTATWAKTDQPVHGIDVLDIFPIGDASVMYYDDISLTQIPEPGVALLLLAGGLGLFRRRR